MNIRSHAHPYQQIAFLKFPQNEQCKKNTGTKLMDRSMYFLVKQGQYLFTRKCELIKATSNALTKCDLLKTRLRQSVINNLWLKSNVCRLYPCKVRP